MKVLDAKVDWMVGWANDPRLQVLVDEIPSYKELRYEKREGMYFAELEGLVHFVWDDPTNHEGFGGRRFQLHMKDDSEVELVGPWSSRSGVANLLDFHKSMEVSITSSKKVWEEGRTFRAGSILMSLGRDAVRDFCPGVIFEDITKGRNKEPNYFLRRVDNPCCICKGSGKDTRRVPFKRETIEEECRHCNSTGHEPVPVEPATPPQNPFSNAGLSEEQKQPRH